MNRRQEKGATFLRIHLQPEVGIFRLNRRVVIFPWKMLFEQKSC